MPIIDERMGISPLEYLVHAMPMIEKLMVADASIFAAKDQNNYLQTVFTELIIAFGGKSDDTFVLKDEIKKIKILKLTKAGVNDFIKNNYVPEALAAWALISVVEKWDEIIKAGAVPPMVAYNVMMENIQSEIDIAKEILVTNPAKIEYNTPPAIVHGICNGIYESNEFVTVEEVCTVIDYSQLQLKNKFNNHLQNNC